MKNTCKKFRKIRGDGNCFYRALIFFYLEKVLIDEKNDA
jgi:hypothetical protein